MRVLDSRHLTAEVYLLSWSPKFDLICVANDKGEVFLYRLNWQKVWTLTVEPTTHFETAWHPDGSHLAVGSDNKVRIIEVESGGVVYSRTFDSKITSMSWRSSECDNSISELLHAQSAQLGDLSKRMPLESKLSLLVISTSDGNVFAMTGSCLLVYHMSIASDETESICSAEISRYLDSLQFLVKSAEQEGEYISYVSYYNSMFIKFASLLGPLGFKYSVMIKNWSVIASELTGLSEQWGKLIDIHTFYLTYGNNLNASEIDEVKADFMELLLTGISGVEMEVFLGTGARKKEVKKNLMLIRTCLNAFTEHLKNIRRSLVSMLAAVNEIEGFLLKITQDKSIDDLANLRINLGHVYLAVVHIHDLGCNFVYCFQHFLFLLLATIQNYNIQEIRDLKEEDDSKTAKTQRVVEFLTMNVKRDLFGFLIDNIKSGRSGTGAQQPPPSGAAGAPRQDALPDYSTNQFPIFQSNGKFPSGTDFVKYAQELMESSDIDLKLELWNLEESHITSFLSNISSNLEQQMNALLDIPVLSSHPFDVTRVQLLFIPKDISNFSDCNDFFQCWQPKHSLWLDTETAKLYCIIQYDLNDVYLFVFNNESQEERVMEVQYIRLQFSRAVMSCEVFTAKLMSVLSYESTDHREDHEYGTTIVCQLSLISCLEKSNVHRLNRKQEIPTRSSRARTTSTLTDDWSPLVPDIVPVVISSSVDANGLPAILENVLCLENFPPSFLNVSGPRKVGAVLDSTRHTIFLLEMEGEVEVSDASDDGGSKVGSVAMNESDGEEMDTTSSNSETTLC